MTKVLVTGANGFVGSVLCKVLTDTGYEVCAATRAQVQDLPVAKQIVVGEMDARTLWEAGLQSGVDTVIHLAARVHVLHDVVNGSLAAYRNVNVAGSLNLARQASAAGVRRFIFISSIKVNGESTKLGRPYRAEDKPKPVDIYGISKREAEDALRQLAVETGMEVVVIRPPLVYGPGVKANFSSMMRWLNNGFPLPLGAVFNRRSLVSLDNLIDLIAICINHPGAANQTFLVSDGEDLSTTELLRRVAKALGKRAWLIPLPVWFLDLGAGLLGKRPVAQRLLGSLQVDISKTRVVLGWTPPVSVDEALLKTAQYFKNF